MSDSHDLEWARHLLDEWAHWLLRGGGYAHQSTIEWWKINSYVESPTHISHQALKQEKKYWAKPDPYSLN